MKTLNRYQVSYIFCSKCESLQSEDPYWLEEAYSDAISGFDTGALQRSLIACSSVTAICKVLGLRGRIIDYGGGAGVLCRLLRDSGSDAWVYDKFADPVFARTFNVNSSGLVDARPQIVTAFEVIEHFSEPAKDLDELFVSDAKALILSTILYNGEDQSWWYLTPDSGQHIFFYSRKAMNLIAKRYNRHYTALGGLHLFTKKQPNPAQSILIRALTSRIGNRLVRIVLSATTTSKYLRRDFDQLKADAVIAREAISKIDNTIVY